MKHLVLALCVVLMSVPTEARGFCFIVSPEFPVAYETARAVFIGEVVRIDKPSTFATDAPLADRRYKVKFKVEFSWKGAGFREVGMPEVVVLSDQGEGGDCFSWGTFLEGEKYLVFARETSDKNLIVELGSRTVLLRKASDDLKELRRLDYSLIPRSRSRVE